MLLEELINATLGGTRKAVISDLAAAPLLIIDDLGMRKLPTTAAEDMLEVIVRRYERASTILTSNRPVDDWGKLLGDTAAVTALLDRLLHHAHVLICSPRSWRTKRQPAADASTATARLPSRSAPVWWPVLRCRSVAGFEGPPRSRTTTSAALPRRQATGRCGRSRL